MLRHADASGRVNFQGFKRMMLNEITTGAVNMSEASSASSAARHSGAAPVALLQKCQPARKSA